MGLLLDLEIRRATGGARSLDDLMRLLWERYGARDVGFPEDTRGGDPGARRGGGRARAWRTSSTATCGARAELDYDAHLAAVGLRLERSEGRTTVRRPRAAEPTASPTRRCRRRGWAMRTREHEGRLRITHVLEGGPAARRRPERRATSWWRWRERRPAPASSRALLREGESRGGGGRRLPPRRADDLRRGARPAPRRPKLRLAQVRGRPRRSRGAALADWLRGEGGARS